MWYRCAHRPVQMFRPVVRAQLIGARILARCIPQEQPPCGDPPCSQDFPGCRRALVASSALARRLAVGRELAPHACERAGGPRCHAPSAHALGDGAAGGTIHVPCDTREVAGLSEWIRLPPTIPPCTCSILFSPRTGHVGLSSCGFFPLFAAPVHLEASSTDEMQSLQRQARLRHGHSPRVD